MKPTAIKAVTRPKLVFGSLQIILAIVIGVSTWQINRHMASIADVNDAGMRDTPAMRAALDQQSPPAPERRPDDARALTAGGIPLGMPQRDDGLKARREDQARHSYRMAFVNSAVLAVAALVLGVLGGWRIIRGLLLPRGAVHEDRQGIAAAVQRRQRSAEAGAGLAAEAARAAEDGRKMVGEMIGAMHAIDLASAKVVDVIGMIDGIACQTDRLAVKAAVEAARAGESGDGFALVATEVRALAQRAAGAARQVRMLIGDVAHAVDAGSRQVAQAGTAIDDVAARMERVAAAMRDIAGAAHADPAHLSRRGNLSAACPSASRSPAPAC